MEWQKCGKVAKLKEKTEAQSSLRFCAILESIRVISFTPTKQKFLLGELFCGEAEMSAK